MVFLPCSVVTQTIARAENSHVRHNKISLSTAGELFAFYGSCPENSQNKLGHFFACIVSVDESVAVKVQFRVKATFLASIVYFG